MSSCRPFFATRCGSGCAAAGPKTQARRAPRSSRCNGPIVSPRRFASPLGSANARGLVWGDRMKQLLLSFVALVSASVSSSPATASAHVASRPPMGWNSWDSYGFTISEEQFKENADALARMRRLGWNIAVIDEGWYMGNPLGRDLGERQYRYDRNGRLVPDIVRFPSAADGQGLKALANWVHAKGLKFGIHIIRGIPKAAVQANLPIAGSTFHAANAAVISDTCPWDDANYGVADNAAGQAWYDSLLRQYASWGIDFLKVDCIADHPYKAVEIREIATAIRKAGRPIILSLSPGPTRLEHASEVTRYAQMWRIMDDLWDGWTFPHDDSTSEFPNGIRNAFDRLAAWNDYVGDGSWPDADMLPLGSLHPHPGWGDPRDSRLSEKESRTALTLWSIARSPLILGGNLTQQPEFLRAMLTNKDVIALNQADRVSRPVESIAIPTDMRVWVSRLRNGPVDTVAMFNVGELPIRVNLPWSA